MPHLETSGANPTTLFYQDAGSGPPVVLIHGWPYSHRMWERQVPALVEAGFRVVAYDRRGFGDSGRPWAGYDYDTFAADLENLLDELDLTKAALVGFSMGGGEVARYLGRYGADRVSKAAFVSSVTPFLLETDANPDGVPQKVFDGMKAKLLEDRPAFIEGFQKDFFGVGVLSKPVSEPFLRYNHTIASFASPEGTVRCVDAFAATDFRADVQGISVPTLVVHGTQDQIVPVEASADRMPELLPAARLERIGGAPHGLFETHADDLNRLLVDFLRG